MGETHEAHSYQGDYSPNSPFLGATSAKLQKLESKTTLHLVSH